MLRDETDERARIKAQRAAPAAAERRRHQAWVVVRNDHRGLGDPF